MNTLLQTAQRYDYEGNQATLDYELQFLPRSKSEWLRRTSLLVDELRTLQPLSGALHASIAGQHYYCIDGVMVKVAHENGVLSGDWSDAGYYVVTPEETGELDLDTVHRELAANGVGTVTANPATGVETLLRDGGEAVSFDYASARDLPEGLQYEEDQLDGPAAPPEVRLWFGMDVEPFTGQPKIVDLLDLGMQFAHQINGKYGIALPGAATTVGINDKVGTAAVNPLHLFADVLEAGSSNPLNSLWHPYTVSLTTADDRPLPIQPSRIPR